MRDGDGSEKKYRKVRKRRERENSLLRSNNLEEKGEYLKENMENRYHKVCAKNEDKDAGGTE